ncbi:MAG: MBL fold metallo-hydrolase [candidate division KSB1 bacterium]|nr:MBL fold metallo-hydrolase [candidate division KSB1 bacterium]
MFTYDKSIRLLDSMLTLDARNYSEACCVSHAHTDHIRSHRRVFATPPTIEFMKRRLRNVHATAANFNEPFEFDGYRLTFLPAGHILGSAQILAERGDRRLLYSGDFKLGKSATSEELQFASSALAEVLIMECTFGHPRYQFPPRQEIIDRLCDWTHTTLRNGAVPVIFAYALGKSQEVMKILADHGFALCVHPAILRLAKIYEKFGCHFGDAIPFRRSEPVAERVLIMPSSARRTRHVEKIRNKRTMYLSGWAIDAGAKFRFGVDEALPLSDHADFPSLIEYARRVNPKKIFTTHGPADFARQLRSLGYQAEPLVPQTQGELF